MFRGSFARGHKPSPFLVLKFVTRINRRNIVWLIMLGLAVHFFLPQIGEVPAAIGAVAHANLGWVSGSLLASALTYLVSALIFQAAVPRRLPLRPFILAQVASSFTNRLAPGAIGGLALAVRFLQKQGSSVVEAATAAAIARLGGAVSAIALTPVLLLLVRDTNLHVATPPRGLAILLTVVGVLLLATGVLAVPKLRQRGRVIARDIASNVRAFATSGRVLRLLALSFALTLAYGACLYFAMLAVGVVPSIAHVLLISIAGESVGSAAPTPGGVGATEAALVSGLVIFGVPTAAAIAGVLVYRVMSFWLPIVPGFLAFQRLTAKGCL